MTAIKAKYKIGDTFKLSDDALDNYGEQYRDHVFRVTSVSTFYCSAKHHFAPGHPQNCAGHPGFDNVGSALYEFENVSHADDRLQCAIYDWEMESA